MSSFSQTHLKTFLVVVLLISGSFIFLASATVSAASEGDYSYTISNEKATITGYSGPGGAIAIPSSLGGYPVVAIGSYSFFAKRTITSAILPDGLLTVGEGAFFNCSGIQTIQIPSSVSEIGPSPFAGCSAMTAINVSYGNANYASVEGVLFNKNVTAIVQYPAGREGGYSIPESLVALQDEAFAYCTKLTSINISRNLTAIGRSIFFDCSALNSINVDAHNPAFSSIDGILFNAQRSILIQYPAGRSGGYEVPDTVITIGQGAFLNSLLTYVTIPSNVRTISSSAFAYSESLVGVNLSNGLETIGDNAFRFCAEIDSLIIPDSVLQIGDAAFEACNYVNNITLGQGVTSIGTRAFYFCSWVHTIVIPDNVTSIGRLAFSSCGMQSVTIGRNVNVIGDSAFADCRGLTSITFLGDVAPMEVGDGWVQGTDPSIRGFAPANSNFPPPGSSFHGLQMGPDTHLDLVISYLVIAEALILIAVIGVMLFWRSKKQKGKSP